MHWSLNGRAGQGSEQRLRLPPSPADPAPYPPPRYDAIHNPHLGLAGLDELYAEAKALADAVIPNE